MKSAGRETSHPEVAGELRRELRSIEETGLRGAPGDALGRLVTVQTRVPTGDPPPQIATAELAVLLGQLGGPAGIAQWICDRALAGLRDAGARGHVLLCRGEVTAGLERRASFTAAVTEFSLAEDDRGTALALAGLAFPCDDEMSFGYRARLASDALTLALASGDPHAIAVCAASLAACETCLGRDSALARWRQAAEAPPPGIDRRTAPVMSRTHIDWALTASGLGDHALAARVANEGAALARGRYWERMFAAVEAVVGLRRGELGAAGAAAIRARAGMTGDQPGAIGAVVAAVCSLQQQTRPDVAGLDKAVAAVAGMSKQLGPSALAVQARVRAQRREPYAHRGLSSALELVRRRELRFGWEDLLAALAETSPRMARGELDRLAGLWPAGRRAAAVRIYVDGLLAGDAGYGLLVEAGEQFQLLPEPINAGRAFHAAARIAPDPATGSRLRLRAVELFRAAGADRALAEVLREGRRHSAGLPRIPASQSNAVHAGLTPREHEVALLAQRGLTAREIAERLSLSVGTVRNHLLRLRGKLGGVPKRRLTELLTPYDPPVP